MKTLFVLFSALFLMKTGVFAQGKIEFETLEINYGDITKGANGVREFKFRNTGTAPFTVTDAKGSCGCTVPTKPDGPIMPGETNVIKVKYDTQRVGPFTKQVTLTTDSNETIRLTIRGNVLPEPDPTRVNGNGGLNGIKN